MTQLSDNNRKRRLNNTLYYTRIIQHITTHKHADNIFILAGSMEQLTTMLQELGQAVYSASLEWKQSSLSFMACGCTHSSTGDLSIQVNGATCSYKEVERLEVLGSILDSNGSTFESWAYRREKADGKYYANLRTLRARGSLQCRIRAWIGAPVASAMLGAETWHLTAGVLHSAWTWEMNRLRHMFRMKYKAIKTKLIEVEVLALI